MIRGKVNSRREAVVRLKVRGPGLTEVEVEAVVDTGFSASLTLPATLVTELGLERQSRGRATLADGSVAQFDIHAAEVAWGDGWRPVLVSAVGTEALVGMRLLADHELRIEVVPGGLVEVRPLPPPVSPRPS